MNIDLLLSETDFSFTDKERIGIFLTPLFTNFQINGIEYEQAEYGSAVIIKTKYHSYHFVKRKNEADVFLFVYDSKKDCYIDYQFYKTYIPVRAYSYIDGELTGKGHGDKKSVQRVQFVTAYLDPTHKLDISFNGSGANVTSITVFLQEFSLKKNGKTLKLELVNKYFSIDTKKLTVMNDHHYNPSFYNTVFNEHRVVPCKKNIYSHELADIFMGSVKVTGIGVDVFSDSGRKEISNFMSIIQMMTI